MVVLLLACAGGDTVVPVEDTVEDTGPMPCNGDVALCERSLSDVSFPTTHNAMSNADAGWLFPNQNHGLSQQFDDGIRGYMLDVHYNEAGEAALCHGYCELGETALATGLGELKDGLERDPGAVVVLLMEPSDVAATDVEAGFEASGLGVYLREQGVDEPWPTLADLLAAGERVVAFTDQGGGAFPGYLDMWSYNYDNLYAAETPEDLNCDLDRGVPGAPLYVFNHFLGNPLPSPENAESINYNPTLLEHAQRCEAERQQLPNFVTVDFYDIGDLFEAVRTLNGLE